VVPELKRALREVGSQLFQKLFDGPIDTAYHKTASPSCDPFDAMTLAKRLKAMGSKKHRTEGDPGLLAFRSFVDLRAGGRS
jgi:hypothetical protein